MFNALGMDSFAPWLLFWATWKTFLLPQKDAWFGLGHLNLSVPSVGGGEGRGGVYAWSQPVRGQEKVPSAEGVGEGWGVSVRAGVD